MSRKLIIVTLMTVSLLLAGCNQKPEEETVVQTESFVETEETTVSTEETTICTEETIAGTEETTVCTEETALLTEAAEYAVPEEVPEEIKAVYETVLNQYREAIMMDSEEYHELYWAEADIESSISTLEYLRDPSYLEIIKECLQRPTIVQKYPYINRADLFWGAHYSLSSGEDDSEGNDLHYAYYDWDGNGIAELLVGYVSAFEGIKDSIIGIYTIIDGKIVTIENEIGQRAGVELYDGGMMCMSGSNSASEYVVEYYRLDSRYGWMNVVCTFAFDSNDPNMEYISQAHELFSEHLVPVTQFDWMNLFPEE